MHQILLQNWQQLFVYIPYIYAPTSVVVLYFILLQKVYSAVTEMRGNHQYITVLIWDSDIDIPLSCFPSWVTLCYIVCKRGD